MTFTEEQKVIVALCVVVLYQALQVWLLRRRVRAVEGWIGAYLQITGRKG